MAVAPRFAAFEVVDLRLLRPAVLAPLFEEEQRHWWEELRWDYRPSVELIQRHIEARSLPGYVALSQGQVAGYCFFVYEDHKGLLGDLYVLAARRQERPYGNSAGIASLLLEHALETLEQSPNVRRVEAQLIPFGLEPLDPLFQTHHFRCFLRLFMRRRLVRQEPWPAAASPVPGIELRPWDDRYFEAMAELIVGVYSGHVDSLINDHYSSRAGAMRFLKNIVIFPGCGVFQTDGSFVALETSPGGRVHSLERLAGAVLASQVGRGEGHITQICLRRDLQGRGLGRRLLEAALGRLAARGFAGVSLTVTAENQAAVKLYRQLGFETIKEFSAYARNLK
ncbi:MAG: GNAT family N-acetyltransferase [Acidobacteria bacterium]|nr:GNAT family N-acetyltransferase [Acidobacteriota bacterium]